MAEGKEGASTEAPSLSREYLEHLSSADVKGYKGPAGVSIHTEETVDLFNLLEANPREWNRRLRVVLAGWIIHLHDEGKIDGHFEVMEKNRNTPGR